MRKLSYKHFALKGGTKDGPVHKSRCKVNVLHATSTFRWHAYTSTCSKQEQYQPWSGRVAKDVREGTM